MEHIWENNPPRPGSEYGMPRWLVAHSPHFTTGQSFGLGTIAARMIGASELLPSGHFSSTQQAERLDRTSGDHSRDNTKMRLERQRQGPSADAGARLRNYESRGVTSSMRSSADQTTGLPIILRLNCDMLLAFLNLH
jgi:hypothetical protein